MGIPELHFTTTGSQDFLSSWKYTNSQEEAKQDPGFQQKGTCICFWIFESKKKKNLLINQCHQNTLFVSLFKLGNDHLPKVTGLPDGSEPNFGVVDAASTASTIMMPKGGQKVVKEEKTTKHLPSESGARHTPPSSWVLRHLSLSSLHLSSPESPPPKKKM